MNVFVPKAEHEGFLLDCMSELSDETIHGKVLNIMVLAFTENGDVVSSLLNASQTNQVACMIFHAQTHTLAHEILMNRQYYEELYCDDEPDCFDPDNPPTDDDLRSIDNE